VPKKKLALALMATLLAVSAVSLCWAIEAQKKKIYTDFTGFVPIVLDAGHGGGDPGKVGRMAYESDINLAIAKKLSDRLTLRGFLVIMTREDEKGLVENGAKWAKKTDSKLRRDIISRSNAEAMISIHQNSHQNAASSGAQVFYNDSLDANKELAEIMQQKMKEISPIPNKREIVCNNEFFVLKGNTMPSCMIECGFISNKREEALLNSEEYQEQIAQAIYEGLLEFFRLSP
jgi:N-acetylmuramoyl-L-alanine amidase